MQAIGHGDDRVNSRLECSRSASFFERSDVGQSSEQLTGVRRSHSRTLYQSLHLNAPTLKLIGAFRPPRFAKDAQRLSERLRLDPSTGPNWPSVACRRHPWARFAECPR